MRIKTRASGLRPASVVGSPFVVALACAASLGGAGNEALAGPVSARGGPAAVAIDASGNAFLVGDSKLVWTAPRSAGAGSTAFRWNALDGDDEAGGAFLPAVAILPAGAAGGGASRPPDALACVPGAMVYFDGGAHTFGRVAADGATLARAGDACAVSGRHIAVARTSGSRTTVFLSRVEGPASSPRLVARGEYELPGAFGAAVSVAGDRGAIAGAASGPEASFVFLSRAGGVSRLEIDSRGVPALSTGTAPARPGTPRGASASGAPVGSRTSVTLFGDRLLRAGDEGVWLVGLGRPAGGTGGAAGAFAAVPERLPVNPCAERETCGTSLASDGSWLVCGSWGCTLGTGSVRSRVRVPNLGEESGHLAVAHAGAKGRYVYLGPSDGDHGILSGTAGPAGERGAISSEAAATRETALPTSRDPRRVVWTRPRHATAREALESARRGPLARREGALPVRGEGPLFPYWEVDARGVRRYGAVGVVGEVGTADPRGSEGSARDGMGANSAEAAGGIPREWAAWEEPATFDAPSRPSAPGLPSEAAGTWWRQALRLDALAARLAASGRTLAPVKVGIVDSGVDLAHPAFAEGVLADERYDFVDDDGAPQDEFGHGSHVAALVASRTPPGRAVGGPAPSEAGARFGIAPNASLVVARALDRGGRSNSIDLARALAFVHASGARVVNCSWGGGPETRVLRDAFAWLVEEGLFVASSAGNDALDLDTSPQVPKNFPGVVNTGALDSRGARAPFSNRGKASVLLFAPGVDILSAVPGGGLAEKSGTSMASPLTTGTAALLLGLGLGTSEVKEVLCATASEGPISRDSRCGALAPLAAVERALAP